MGRSRHRRQNPVRIPTLEAAQAGLSWATILKKREGCRKCFAEFDPVAVAGFGAEDVGRLLLDASIIRNRKKIESAISNARLFLEIAAKHGSFARWYWSFCDATRTYAPTK